MMSNLERLVYMANQIARNFEIHGQDDAVKSTADHIAHFWDPRMKAQIFDFHAKRTDGLSEAAAAAVALLSKCGTPPSQTRATEFNTVDEAGHSDAG